MVAETAKRPLKAATLPDSHVEENRQGIAESKELLAAMMRHKDRGRGLFINAKREIIKKAEAALRALEPPNFKE